LIGFVPPTADIELMGKLDAQRSKGQALVLRATSHQTGPGATVSGEKPCFNPPICFARKSRHPGFALSSGFGCNQLPHRLRLAGAQVPKRLGA
jgi:hypothetical protein